MPKEFVPFISVFASSIRPNLWKDFFQTIEKNRIPFEVIFSGPLPEEVVQNYRPRWEPGSGHVFHYVHTGNIKPAQAYQIAQMNCQGQLVHWTADDAEYSPNLLDRIWEYWLQQGNPKTILSCQTIEDGNLVVLEHHRLFGRAFHTPQMAPLGFMDARFWEEIGGIDRRYISGQWDNDIVLRAMNEGGKVELFTDYGEISLHHGNKHGGNSGTFRTAYKHDRTILEGAWAPLGRDQQFEAPPFKRYDTGFEPFDYTDPNFLTVSQGPKGLWV